MKLAGEVTFTIYRNVCNNPLMNEIEKESLIKHHPKKRNFTVKYVQHNTSSNKITLLESTHRIGSDDIESKNSYFSSCCYFVSHFLHHTHRMMNAC